jgi:hypothetical protein
MTHSSSRVSFHNDPVSRMVMRLLLLLELTAMILVLGLCLLDRFILALLISFLTLFLLLAAVAWLYLRYQTLPVVREKKDVTRFVLKFERHSQIETLRIQSARKERTRLNHAEKQEAEAALRSLQKGYIETGLAKASINQALIPGIGSTLKERLAEHGILHAADVNSKIASLEGFGESKYQALLGWRNTVIATLESTKPSALPPEQLNPIQQKYHELQDTNNAAERKAISSQQILEHELMSFKPHLRALGSFTFLRYLRRSLASRGIVAALVAFLLVLTPLVSSVSATLAFGASSVAALMAPIPVTGATATRTSVPSLTETMTGTFTATDVRSQTHRSTFTDTSTMTFTPTAARTNTPAATFTPLPTLTLRPANTPTVAVPPVSNEENPANCDSSYPTVCIPPAPPDLDCGDIPYDNFQVLPPDPHNFDREGDGLGCEG